MNVNDSFDPPTPSARVAHVLSPGPFARPPALAQVGWAASLPIPTHSTW